MKTDDALALRNHQKGTLSHFRSSFLFLLRTSAISAPIIVYYFLRSRLTRSVCTCMKERLPATFQKKKKHNVGSHLLDDHRRSQIFEFFSDFSNFFKVNLKAGSLGYCNVNIQCDQQVLFQLVSMNFA